MVTRRHRETRAHGHRGSGRTAVASPTGRAVVGGLLVAVAARRGLRPSRCPSPARASDTSSPRTRSSREHGSARVTSTTGRGRPARRDCRVPRSPTRPAHRSGRARSARRGRARAVRAVGRALVCAVRGRRLASTATGRSTVSSRPGEQVAVLATYGSGPDAVTLTVVGSALVERIDATIGSRRGHHRRRHPRPRRPRPTAQAVVHAARAGELTLRAHRAAVAGSAYVAPVSPAAALPTDADEASERAIVSRGERFVVLGLGQARSSWFRDLARLAHAGGLPIEFVKCVSHEEARVRLASGRSFSALLVDGGLPGVDRDLIDDARRGGRRGARRRRPAVVARLGRTRRDRGPRPGLRGGRPARRRCGD